MAFDKVIIFGPTGNIGSVAARTASKKGAKVYLAMRNTNKDIPGLTKEAEQSGNYERIEADLTNADTVRSAVEKSGAQAAFLYLAHGTPDHMQSTFQALKDGGIKHVVFLSSFTVPKDNMEDVPPSDMISYIHSQAELNMRKLFAKDQVVAIRPGAFATNVLHYKLGITERKIKHISPKHVSDMITNEDMGEVSGTILVEGQRGGQDFVYLFGPEMVSEEKAFQTIGKILGEDVEVVKVDADEGTQVLVREGLPEPIAKYLVNITLKMDASGEEDMALPKGRHAEGKANVEKYTGHPALGFEEWAGRNKEMFI